MAAAGQRDRHLRSEACLARGVERYIAGDLRGAAELFREGLRAQPADVQLTAYLAWVEARLQSDEPAVIPRRHPGENDDAPAEELLAGAELGEGRGMPLTARGSLPPGEPSPFAGAEAPVRRFLAQAPTRPNLVPLDVPELTDEKLVELAGTPAASRGPAHAAAGSLPRPLLTASIAASIRPDPAAAVAFPPTVEFVPSFDLSLPTNTIQGLGTMAQPPPANSRETVAVIYTRTDANDEGVEVGATLDPPPGRSSRTPGGTLEPATSPGEAPGPAFDYELLEDDDEVPLLIDDELLSTEAVERAKRTFPAFAPKETQVEVGPPPGLSRAASSTLAPPPQPTLAPPSRSASPPASPSRGPASVLATRRALSPFAERLEAMGRAAEGGDFGGALQIAEDLLTFAKNAGQALPAEHQEAITAMHERALGDRCRFVRMGKLPPHLEPRTAFLLSRVDGSFTVDDLLDISGMDRAAASRLVALLLRSGALVAE